MERTSPIMNRIFRNLQAMRTGRLFLFIIALIITIIAARPAMADTIYMDYFKAFHNVTIVSETKDTVRVKLRDGYVMEVPRKRIWLILKPGMKVNVHRSDWTGFTAWFRSSDNSGYTFAARPDGTGGFTVKKGEIFFITSKFPTEKGQESTIKPRPWWLELNAWSLLYAAGFLQGIFLAFMLFRRKNGNLRANRVLALFIINGSMFFSTGFTKPYIYIYPYLNQVYDSIMSSTVFLIGPLLYLYLIVLTRPVFRLRLRHCLHLLPAGFCCIYLLCDAVMMNRDQLAILLSGSSCVLIPSITHNVLSTALCILPVLYVIFSMRFLAAHRRRIQDIFSSTEKLNLSWLSFILRFMMVVSVIWIVPATVSRINLFLNFDHNYLFFAEIMDNFINLAGGLIVILFFAIGYRGLAQPEIFAGIPDDVVEEPDDPGQKISISPEKTREILDRVTKVMEEQRPYLDPGLTLPMLADMAGVSRNLLSQAINERTGQNFYDFVNFYRVETVKEQMKDPAKRDMNLLHLALDAGFNSKATFNAVFKKNTSLTPTAYRKSILDN